MCNSTYLRDHLLGYNQTPLRFITLDGGGSGVMRALCDGKTYSHKEMMKHLDHSAVTLNCCLT